MKRIVQFLLILVAIAAVVGLAALYGLWQDTGTGGDTRVEERTLPPFHQVAIQGFADVTLIQGNTEALSVAATRKQLRRMDIRVKDGRLTLASHQPGRWWFDIFGGGARPARVTLNLRSLDAISAEGAVKVRADRLATDRLAVSASGATFVGITDLDAKELTIDGSGAMKIEIAGRAVRQSVEISGAGDYRAADLASESASVEVSGAGRVVVRVDKALAVDLSGAATVEYLGNPKVTRQISGVGRVKRREASSEPQWTWNLAASEIDSGLNSSGKPVASARSACTPASVRMSVTRQSRSNWTSMATTSPARSSG
jgi:Putative auto-transporter adhesin, head GIN domain